MHNLTYYGLHYNIYNDIQPASIVYNPHVGRVSTEMLHTYN